MTKNNKICLVIPDLQKGGMERVMSELANYFSEKKDAEVCIVLLTKQEQSEVFYKISDRVVIYEPTFEFSKKSRFLSTVRTLFFLRKTISRINPCTILSFGETYNSFVLLSTLFQGRRVFVSDRSKPDKSWGFLQENLRRLLYPTSAGIIAQTTYAKEFQTKEIGHKNITVIPNPVRKIQYNGLHRKNVVLYVGRLFNTKRLDLLLNIFSKCDNDGWELWLVGKSEGEEETELRKIANSLHIIDKVKFWGKQEDVDSFYSTAEIFAFTSVSEGLPNVLLEAMAAGLACISFDCIAGPSDLITDGESGFLIKTYDIDDYVMKLNLLMKDSQLREKFSINARTRSKNFDIKIIGDKFYDFLLS